MAVLTGLRLIGRYRYAAHALCASGPAILFVTIYATYDFYHFRGNAWIGLLPLLFALIALGLLLWLLRIIPAETDSRSPLVALFAGVTLFFVSLVFPLQFDRYLYTYGIVTACIAAAAHLWRPPEERYREIPVRSLRSTRTQVKSI